MKHVDHITSLIRTLRQNETFHALVIQSPPGWAKSATIESALKIENAIFFALGSFSTPLSLYNAICDHPESILVLDDCAGLFEDVAAMSILKAATWPSVGSNGERRVAWNTTSDRARKESTTFKGKIILLCNSLPAGREMESFLSRTLHLSLNFDGKQVAEMLLEAAKRAEYYEDTELSVRVADYLSLKLGQGIDRKINLRTLRMCYEVAKSNSEGWEAVVDLLMPKLETKDLVKGLSQSSENVEEQIRQFRNVTGLSRRTYYNYQRRLRDDAGVSHVPYAER